MSTTCKAMWQCRQWQCRNAALKKCQLSTVSSKTPSKPPFTLRTHWHDHLWRKGIAMLCHCGNVLLVVRICLLSRYLKAGEDPLDVHNHCSGEAGKTFVITHFNGTFPRGWVPQLRLEEWRSEEYSVPPVCCVIQIWYMIERLTKRTYRPFKLLLPFPLAVVVLFVICTHVRPSTSAVSVISMRVMSPVTRYRYWAIVIWEMMTDVSYSYRLWYHIKWIMWLCGSDEDDMISWIISYYTHSISYKHNT